MQKLKAGAPLVLKRIAGAEDTYEICVCHSDGREIDLLTYAESIGIAPYMDAGLVTATAKAEAVQVKQGKSRAKDLTTLTVSVDYEYDDTVLEICRGSQATGFVTEEDEILSLAVMTVVNGDNDILAQRPYLNLYTLDLAAENGTVKCTALFNESFTKCKISAEIYDKDNNAQKTELEENEKQTVLTLVNHARIFEGEEGVNCEIEQETGNER
ncbi:MAG: hypothetical protein IJD80_04005 [Oscillospiraceae bacterium]|nr:hypothetical protein [Oscillospiraceae bacterium]